MGQRDNTMLDYTIPAFQSTIAIGIAFKDVVATVEELRAGKDILSYRQFPSQILASDILAIVWIAIAAVLELFRDTSSAGSTNMIIDKTELERHSQARYSHLICWPLSGLQLQLIGAAFTGQIFASDMLAIVWIAIAAVLELFRDMSSAGGTNMIVNKTELEGAAFTGQIIKSNMLAIVWIAIAAVLELFRDTTSSAGSTNMIVNKTELER
ncbi:MAG: hypothetical protein FRX48_09512 [Lasallia pustulata]|uniref:Uncharacterized protein n=1 Tax=Lasallia pustulata TaxID=136370 RepID=A0A5M8PCW8_9LECA|nr:MAG: hypothetical protein FRX48_09512 [Lasallia pustulata]